MQKFLLGLIVNYFKFSMKIITSDNDILFLLFLFTYFYFTDWLRVFETMMNTTSYNGHCCLIYLKENATDFSPLSIIFSEDSFWYNMNGCPILVVLYFFLIVYYKINIARDIQMYTNIYSLKK